MSVSCEPVPPAPVSEARLHRQEVLRGLRALEPPPHDALEAVLQVARQLSGCPIAMINLVGEDTVHHLASLGLTLHSTPADQAFCAHAVGQGGYFEVPDAQVDLRFRDWPVAQGPAALRFYGAHTLVLDGASVGTLCVVDHRPGRLAEGVPERLADLAHVVVDLLRWQRQCQALEDQARRLQDLARASGDWMWELDAQGCLIWVSAEFEGLTGIAPASVMGQPLGFEPLVDPDGADLSPPRRLGDLLDLHQPFSRVVSRRETPRGSLLLSRSGVPVFDRDGAFRGFRGTTRDVTAMVDAERRRRQFEQSRLDNEVLRREKAAAENANRAKSAFLSRASHELRTPLNAVVGFAQLMAMDHAHPLAPEQAHRLDGIRRAGQHLLDMITDVLDLARIEQGAQRLRREPVDLPSVVVACLATVRPLAEARGVRLLADLPAQCVVMGDAMALEQVIINLLSNAIKYNRPGGEATVRAGRDGGRIWFSVSDQGQGLDPTALAQLFQPFNRLGAERRRIEGSGLGLVIVRELAQAMAGEVEARSQPGEGSEFVVRLEAADPAAGPLPPVAAGAASSTAPVVAPDEAPDTARVTAPTAGTVSAFATVSGAQAASAAPRQVLYIEDEPLNVVLMQEIFRAHPQWTLQVARDGQEGVELATRLLPDLVLVDMNLPDISGLEVLRRLREHEDTRGLTCVALSADAMSEQIEAARAAGFDDYWTKPIDLMGLIAAIERLLAARP